MNRDVCRVCGHPISDHNTGGCTTEIDDLWNDNLCGCLLTA